MTKIMLVEDDNNLREIYQARLEAEGYEIVSAMDGEAALAIASKELPDLVISDVMMPKISGFEMLDILRNTEALKNVKIIMLTALGQTEDSTRASNLGANRYLVKSQVTLEDIVKATHELLDAPVAAPAAPDAAEIKADASQADSSPADPIPASVSGPSPALGAFVQEPAPPTPTMNVVEPPAEDGGKAVPIAMPAATGAVEPPSLPSSEAEVQQAAPVPALQEEASINDQIKDFVAEPVPEAAPAANPTPAGPPPVTSDLATPAPAPMPAIQVSAPAPPAAPVPSAAPSQQVDPDLADFEPAAETLNPNPTPKITNSGDPVSQAQTIPSPTADPVPAPQPAPAAPADNHVAPSYNRPLPDEQPAADREMANAINGLAPGGESEDAPSGGQNANMPGHNFVRGIDTGAPKPAPAADEYDDEDTTPKKKVIKPLHDLNDKPDINKLLELENAKNSAQQAAQATGGQVPGGLPPIAPAGGMPAPQPQQPSPVDPNSISL
jgi:CheY-like chemotaxis protein